MLAVTPTSCAALADASALPRLAPARCTPWRHSAAPAVGPGTWPCLAASCACGAVAAAGSRQRRRRTGTVACRADDGGRRLGYSQRVEEEFDDLGSDGSGGNITLDFKGGEERLKQVENMVRTPVTLLSGFLGAGKTTLLKHTLQNQEGVRIGVIVNDVAAINIDSQLVQRYERDGAIEMAELSNGCVCCTATDDLVATVQDLMNRCNSRQFHHILIELSGIGEPERIRRHWDIGVEVGLPATMMTEIKRTVTVIDASTFGNDWLDSRKASERNEEEGVDLGLSKSEHGTLETVGQLLAEQVEKADLVLLNKVDLATPGELKTSEEVARALNPRADVVRTTFGQVSPTQILPEIPDRLRFPEFGQGKNYQWAQSSKGLQIRVQVPPETRSGDISFKIGRNWMEIWVEGEPVPRLQGKLYARIVGIDEWLWELDGSGDDRHVAVWLEKSTPGMWEDLWEKLEAGEAAPTHEPGTAEDESQPRAAASSGHGDGHGHGHGHGHDHGDEHGHGHGHGHGHDHDHGSVDDTTAKKRFGIHNFTYRMRRPFNAMRLNRFIDQWPLPQENKTTFDLSDLRESEADEDHNEEGMVEARRALKPVLRSKGFCWLDSDPLKNHEWAHAGRSITVLPKDWWWSILKEEQLEFQVCYPGAKKEYDMVKESERWDERWGDRRQELVFIGGPDMSEDRISALLDSCLLDDSEMDAFCERNSEVYPADTYFGVEGLIRQMGEDPANFGRRPDQVKKLLEEKVKEGVIDAEAIPEDLKCTDPDCEDVDCKDADHADMAGLQAELFKAGSKCTDPECADVDCKDHQDGVDTTVEDSADAFLSDEEEDEPVGDTRKPPPVPPRRKAPPVPPRKPARTVAAKAEK